MFKTAIPLFIVLCSLFCCARVSSQFLPPYLYALWTISIRHVFSKCLLSLKRMNTNYLSSQTRKEKHVSGTFALLETYPWAGGSLKAVRQDAACHSNESTFFFFVRYQKARNLLLAGITSALHQKTDNNSIYSFRNTEHALNYQCTHVLLLYLT